MSTSRSRSGRGRGTKRGTRTVAKKGVSPGGDEVKEAEMSAKSKSSSKSYSSTTTTTMTTMSSSKRRASGVVLNDRMKEREELQDVNLRLANLIENYEKGVPSTGPFFSWTDFEEYKSTTEEKIRMQEMLFKEKLQRKNRELERFGQQVSELREEGNGLKESVEEMTLKMSKMDADSRRLRAQRDAERKEKDRAKHELEAEKETLEARERRLLEENESLTTRLSHLEQLMRSTEAELEASFSARLSAELSKREAKWQAEKIEMQEQMEERFNELKESQMKRTEELLVDLKRKARLLAQAEVDLGKAIDEREAIRKELEKERRRRELAENDLRFVKHALNKELDEERKKYQELEDAYNLQCDQMFTTMNLNADLRAEIDELKMKLDMFEDKMGIDSPLRRRKRIRRDPKVMKTIAIDSIKSDEISARGSFPLENINRQYSGDWQGFELQNIWNEPIILKNMSLGNNIAGTKMLKLPSLVIHPSGIIRVCLTDRKKQENDLVWAGVRTDKDVLQELWIVDNNGDKQLLDKVPPGHIEDDNTCRVM